MFFRLLLYFFAAVSEFLHKEEVGSLENLRDVFVEMCRPAAFAIEILK